MMHRAFVDFRGEAYERKDKRVYWISNLLHNLPLRLLNIEKEEEIVDAFKEIKRIAIESGMEPWFNEEVEEITKFYDNPPNPNDPC